MVLFIDKCVCFYDVGIIIEKLNSLVDLIVLYKRLFDGGFL